MLKHHADAKRASMGRAFHRNDAAAPTDHPRVGLGYAVDEFHQCGFTGAILAEDGMDMPAANGERHRIVC